MKIKIGHDFNISGKRYNSIEEVPEDLRELVRKAVGPQSSGIPVITQTRIIFNGAVYDNVEAMPQNIRGLYEEVLKAAKTGAIGHDVSLESNGRSITAGYKSITGLETTAQTPEPALGLSKLITGLAIAALIGAAVYYLL